MHANIIFFVLTIANAVLICPKKVSSRLTVTQFSSFSLTAGRKKHRMNTEDKTKESNVSAILIRVARSSKRFAVRKLEINYPVANYLAIII